jgi:hypothetical protein
VLESWTQFLHAGHRKTPRALRITLKTPLRFRQVGEKSWSSGIATNISSTGVLLHADRNMDVQTAIQMKYLLPVTIAGENGITVFCRGEIVRTEAPTNGGDEFQFAVKIVDFYPGTQWKPDLNVETGKRVAVTNASRS